VNETLVLRELGELGAAVTTPRTVIPNPAGETPRAPRERWRPPPPRSVGLVKIGATLILWSLLPPLLWALCFLPSWTLARAEVWSSAFAVLALLGLLATVFSFAVFVGSLASKRATQRTRGVCFLALLMNVLSLYFAVGNAPRI
jgi:hypothetical protein